MANANLKAIINVVECMIFKKKCECRLYTSTIVHLASSETKVIYG